MCGGGGGVRGVKPNIRTSGAPPGARAFLHITSKLLKCLPRISCMCLCNDLSGCCASNRTTLVHRFHNDGRPNLDCPGATRTTSTVWHNNSAAAASSKPRRECSPIGLAFEWRLRPLTHLRDVVEVVCFAMRWIWELRMPLGLNCSDR